VKKKAWEERQKKRNGFSRIVLNVLGVSSQTRSKTQSGGNKGN